MNTKKIVYAKAPLEISEMKEFFIDRERLFILNYNQSTVKGSMFLSYVSNLEIPHEIDFDNSTGTDKIEMLAEYMRTRMIVDTASLATTAAQVLLARKGVDISQFTTTSFLSETEIAEFIKAEAELVDKWVSFIESTHLYLMSCFEGLSQETFIEKSFPIIENPNYVGLNVIHLFKIVGFMENFMSKPAVTPIYFFKPQFTQYMFKGKNLYPYYAVPENIIYVVFHEMMSGRVEPEDFKKLKEATV